MAAPNFAMIPHRITQNHLTSLQSAFQHTSSRFASYNFREYFLRRSNLKFQRELPNLIGLKEINDHTLSTVEGQDLKTLKGWWQQSVQELAVLERASAMNAMFEGPKLVVEGLGNVMIDGGGGAGMEQSSAVTLSSLLFSYTNPSSSSPVKEVQVIPIILETRFDLPFRLASPPTHKGEQTAHRAMLLGRILQCHMASYTSIG